MIPNNFDTAFEQVIELVNDFNKDLANCTRSDYNESQVRKDYIDKFFIALGWDVNHEQQRNIYAQEVRVERSINVAERTKFADYSFALAPEYRKPIFFVEAKKPSVTLETPANCFQTLRYGYSSSKASLSILTNFKELIVLDCRYLPDFDIATQRIHKRYHFTDFLNFEKFAEVYYLFGREAVADGTYERVCSELPKPKGRVKQLKPFADGYKEIDDSFLEMLESFREELAKNFKRRNPKLDSDDLTEAVQRTLDRLVFIRFLEDKLIEPDTILDKFGFKPNAWGQFIAKSRDFDKTYNGIIFKYHDVIDNPNFVVDDRVFLQICDTFAGDRTPYHFNYIPIHILGSIYERFLGNVIVATAKQARIEAKPEVRKAGGVFYTPQYIVKYIVENTVGALLSSEALPLDVRKGSAFPEGAPNDSGGYAAGESGGVAAKDYMAAVGEAELRHTSSGKAARKITPQDVAKMRFADIACGSGSFLLGVYEYLLAWHTEYYNKKSNAKEAKDAHCIINEDGTFHLSFEQKSDILVNNVYGVDIDRQAHEVTQLSLFLKLLEEETLATKRKLWDTERKAMLPSLANNIVCGNALVDWDISSGDLFEQLDQEKEKRLNPMSFESKFPKVMRNGGFDAIVGNPPYIRIQGFEKNQIEYFIRKYEAARGNFDIYVNFVERAFKLLKPDGMFGQIVPNKFFRTDYGLGLRGFLSKDKWINRIVDFGSSQVFSVTIYTCLLFLKNNPSTSLEYSLIDAGPESLDSVKFMELKADNLDESGWVFADDAVLNLIRKLEENSVRLLDLPATMNRGSSSGCDDVFMVEAGSEIIESAILRTPVFATDFNRYQFHENSEWKIIFPYNITDNGYEVISQSDLANQFPLAYEYLKKNKATLEKRKGYQSWYGYSAPRSLNLHENADILIPLLANKGLFALIPDDLHGKLCPMASGGFTITLGKETGLRREYLLGLLNSKLLFWKLQHLSNVFRGGWITCTKQYIGELPIHTISTADEKAKHDLIVHAVEQIMDAKTKLAAAKNDGERQHLTDKCEKYETDINSAVYSLYGLTADEIDLIENG